MKILVIGAGTIGLTCAHLLSRHAHVGVLAKNETQCRENDTVSLSVKHVGKKDEPLQEETFRPCWAKEYSDGQWDLLLVTVNRTQLAEVMPVLAKFAGEAEILFLLNHWCIRDEVEQYLQPEDYLIGFPAFAGGGRAAGRLDINIYEEALPLGLPEHKEKRLARPDRMRLERVGRIFRTAGISWEYRPDMESWLKVHNLQQAISAGAIRKAGGYDALAEDTKAMREMVRAMKEGIRVCRKMGATVGDPVVRALEKLPAGLTARLLVRMFQDENTARMIKGHMKKGMAEWTAGYLEVLAAGRDLGVAMPCWAGYEEFVCSPCDGR